MNIYPPAKIYFSPPPSPHKLKLVKEWSATPSCLSSPGLPSTPGCCATRWIYQSELNMLCLTVSFLMHWNGMLSSPVNIKITVRRADFSALVTRNISVGLICFCILHFLASRHDYVVCAHHIICCSCYFNIFSQSWHFLHIILQRKNLSFLARWQYELVWGPALHLWVHLGTELPSALLFALSADKNLILLSVQLRNEMV